MKLLQLNVWQGRLIKDICRFLEQEQPDIVCAQEVLSSKGAIPMPNELFESLDLMKRAGKFSHVFFAPTFTSQIAGTHYSFGNAILSRHPLQNLRTIFTNGEYNPLMTDDNYINNARNLLIAEAITGDGQRFTVATHHAHWEPSSIGSAMTAEKLQLVADHLRGVPHPLIFAGDLNVGHESPALEPLNNLFKDLVAEHKITTTLSPLSQVSRFKDVACDHVYVTPGVKVNKFESLKDLLSDHTGLMLEFAL